VQVATVGFAVLAGIMIGHVVGTRDKLFKSLKSIRLLANLRVYIAKKVHSNF
jgi:hypothetical protein